jgi:hypothetical protein
MYKNFVWVKISKTGLSVIVNLPPKRVVKKVGDFYNGIRPMTAVKQRVNLRHEKRHFILLFLIL